MKSIQRHHIAIGLLAVALACASFRAERAESQLREIARNRVRGTAYASLVKTLERDLERVLNQLHTASDPSLESIATQAQLIIRQGANPNTASKEGIRALHLAAYLDDEELAALAIRQGADVNAQDRDGITPLHICAQSGTPTIARLLLTHGADYTIRNAESQIPLQIAEKNHQAAVVRLLNAATRGKWQ